MVRIASILLNSACATRASSGVISSTAERWQRGHCTANQFPGPSSAPGVAAGSPAHELSVGVTRVAMARPLDRDRPRAVPEPSASPGLKIAAAKPVCRGHVRHYTRVAAESCDCGRPSGTIPRGFGALMVEHSQCPPKRDTSALSAESCRPLLVEILMAPAMCGRGSGPGCSSSESPLRVAGCPTSSSGSRAKCRSSGSAARPLPFRPARLATSHAALTTPSCRETDRPSATSASIESLKSPSRRSPETSPPDLERGHEPMNELLPRLRRGHKDNRARRLGRLLRLTRAQGRSSASGAARRKQWWSANIASCSRAGIRTSSETPISARTPKRASKRSALPTIS